jgi:hypothetical protein
MDHATVKASRMRPWNQLRFENDELECLYQRYTMKLQWFSVFGVVALVVVLSGIMAALSLGFTQAPTLHVSLLIFFIKNQNVGKSVFMGTPSNLFDFSISKISPNIFPNKLFS